MIRYSFIICICVLLLTYAMGAVLAQETSPPGNLSNAEKLYGLSLFWKEVSDNFVYFDQVPDLDWDAAYREYIPKVLATENTLEYYQVLQQFCALLNDGHTRVTFPDGFNKYFAYAAGIGVREMDRRAWVLNVDEKLVDKIPLGSEIIRVDGKETQEFLKTEVFPYIASSTEHIRWNWGIEGNTYGGYGLIVRPVGTKIEATIRVPSGELRDVTLVCEWPSEPTKWVKGPSQSRSFLYSWPDDSIAYVQISTFGSDEPIEEFRKITPELLEAKGIILDIRRNGGGNTSRAEAILDYFTDTPLTGSPWKTREQRGAYKAWGLDRPEDPQFGPYARDDAWYIGKADVLQPSEGKKIQVPVLVLIGYKTASAAEDFLIYARQLDNFTFMGQPTFGSTGQPLYFELPGGGSARVCVKRDTLPDGSDFVGHGIQPDIDAARTVESYIQGKSNVGVDNVLTQAVEILKTKIEVRRK